MRAGTLNKLIHIMKVSSWTRSTDGEPIAVWTTHIENIFANVQHQTGKETYRDRYRWEVDETDFIIRWTTHTFDPEMRVRYSGDDYDIKAVINVNERDREIRLITTKHK